jgi:hypothetical protein
VAGELDGEPAGDSDAALGPRGEPALEVLRTRRKPTNAIATTIAAHNTRDLTLEGVALRDLRVNGRPRGPGRVDVDVET